MKFQEIVPGLKEGKKYRFPGMQEEYLLGCRPVDEDNDKYDDPEDPNDIIIMKIMNEKVFKFDWYPTIEDFETNDWIEVKNEMD